ncbi:hypothetical protein M075_0614 [Bacteroides fragilis str. 20793-3]|nr:hypothetical protein M075_0614 [Bacteroides fragilis str. 20793-3]
MSVTQTIYPFGELCEPFADIRKGSSFDGYYFHTLLILNGYKTC